jgi:urate oxidase
MSSLLELRDCAYGKTDVRLVKVERTGAGHDVKDINVTIQVFGDFQRAYSKGDNRSILPTDTMKNTVYVLARQRPLGEIEDFGMRLANHFLAHNPHLTRVRVSIAEKIWQRIGRDSKAQESAFQMDGRESRTALIDSNRDKTSIHAGITGLFLLKTSRSAFENFLHDEYTTLEDTNDRLLCAGVTAEWMYSSSMRDFGPAWRTVGSTLLNSFAAHESQSVQHTLYAMGEAVLHQLDEIEEIRLSISNRHCLLVNLSLFHMENPNEVFVPIEEPSGVMEATITRKLTHDGKKSGVDNIRHDQTQLQLR